MDKKDELILKTFMHNSRTPVTHLANKMGITETAVRKRIAKLERFGAIKAYTAIIDPFFMGFSGIALVGVDTNPEKMLSVFEKIKKISRIRYLALTSGDHMIMFEIWCRNEKILNEELKKIKKLDGVTKVCPAVLMKRIE
ncbi:MAG: Lrp/AsnC family transcriptional regulator [Candidatus Micrarchaeia archaeon]|jgi:Lrp/AsnC family transcriptional regulator for asnA, asnC and gidA